MIESSMPGNVVALDTSVPVWEQFFTVAPLVLIGTRDEDGSLDLAPKHMVTPMGWQNYFGFVCTPRHKTCANIERTGAAISGPVHEPRGVAAGRVRREARHRLFPHIPGAEHRR